MVCWIWNMGVLYFCFFFFFIRNCLSCKYVGFVSMLNSFKKLLRLRRCKDFLPGLGESSAPMFIVLRYLVELLLLLLLSKSSNVGFGFNTQISEVSLSTPPSCKSSW